TRPRLFALGARSQRGREPAERKRKCAQLTLPLRQFPAARSEHAGIICTTCRQRRRDYRDSNLPALSILDLARVTVATDARGALDNARDLAAHAEALGYRRFWVGASRQM